MNIFNYRIIDVTGMDSVLGIAASGTGDIVKITRNDLVAISGKKAIAFWLSNVIDRKRRQPLF